MPLPDHPARLAFATCAARPSIDPDDAHLAATLAQLGLPPTVCVWNDAQVDWSAFDLVWSARSGTTTGITRRSGNGWTGWTGSE
jgi:hypothetical protein